MWDSPVTGNKEKFTYARLLEEVETLAGVLREEGVRKGDVVLIYSMFCFEMERGSTWWLINFLGCSANDTRRPVRHACH